MDDKHFVACAGYADRLVDFSDGELAADERAAVEAHVSQCSACRGQLRRLDASLAALRAGVVDAATVDVRRRTALVRTAAWLAAGTTAAAIVLAIAVSVFKAPTIGRGDPAVAADVRNGGPSTDTPPRGASTQSTPTNGRGFGEGGITPNDALRRIALLEQQARLEMSLALMPDEPWLADQRAANERLLATFRQAATAARADSKNKPEGSKDTL